MEKIFPVRILFLWCVAVSIFFSNANGQTIRYVTVTGSGSKDGTSWTNAYEGTQIQTAINGSGITEVFIAKGTYYPGTLRTNYFQMKNGVAIYGGFAGTEASASERANFGPGGENETILSGDIGIANDSTDNCLYIFYHPDGTNLTSSAVLDGFSIKYAYGHDASGWYYGGGIYNVNSSPTLRNLYIASNISGEGGGIYNESSSPRIENVLIHNNTAQYNGGGIEEYLNSSSTLINVKIYGNHSGDFGGGMYITEASSPILTNVLIAGNSARSKGGGLLIEALSNPTLTNVTVYQNSAEYQGGGINHYYSTLTMNNCIVWDNSATNGGNDFYIDGDNVPENSVTLNYSCYSNDTNNVKVIYGTFTASNHCVTSNPKLIGIDTNVVLNYASPCVNSGNNSYNSTSYDLHYQNRIQSGTIDLGACEWTEGIDPDRVTYVDASRPDDNGNGYSWATAKQTLQSAIDAVPTTSAEQIWVKAGTYKPTATQGSGDRTKAFALKSNLAIYGGFAGTETYPGFDFSSRDFETNKTILSGDIGVQGDSTDNCYHVISNSYDTVDSTGVLDGFSITGGLANDTEIPDLSRGGGMVLIGTSPTLRNLNFYNNAAVYYGGALDCEDTAKPIIVNCFFTNNSADYGGALYCSTDTKPKIVNSLFYNNFATSVGGALYVDNLVTIKMTNVTISGNHATGKGGGIYLYGYTEITLENCITWGNQGNTVNEIYFYDLDGGLFNAHNSCYQLVTFDNSTGIQTTNCISEDPRFVGSSNNPDHPYSLQGVSPCVDAGDNSLCDESYDLRGPSFARKLDKTSGAAGTIDMGAYEYKVGVDALPVELTSFTVSSASNAVTLRWTTSTEVNNYGFEIERSEKVDGRSEMWSKIGFVEGNGTSNSPKLYSFVDKSVQGKIAYRLKQIDRDGKFEYSQTVEVVVGQTPKAFALNQNYPNPFNPATVISFQVPITNHVSLKVYDAIGREVAILVNEVKEAGSYSVTFSAGGGSAYGGNASHLVSGLYFAKLQSGDKMQMKKMLLLK